MQNLKKIASKIVENPGITHARLGSKTKGVRALRKYLPTVGFQLITTYRSIYNPFTRSAYEEVGRRSYEIVRS